MTPSYGRKWRRTKEPLDESERGEWKSWLKAQHSGNLDHGIWSHHFMANRWGTVADFIFLGSKITADGYCSHEIKRCLLLGRKVMTNLDSILKSRDVTLPTKVRLVKGMVAIHGVAKSQTWLTSLSLLTFMHWRRKWQPTPVFLPGESQGRGSLVGCRLWGHTVGHDWNDLAAAAAYICQCYCQFAPPSPL